MYILKRKIINKAYDIINWQLITFIQIHNLIFFSIVKLILA